MFSSQVAAIILAAATTAPGSTREVDDYRYLKNAWGSAPQAESIEGEIARRVALGRSARFAIMSIAKKPLDQRDNTLFDKLNKEINLADEADTRFIAPLVARGDWLKGRFNKRTVQNIWLIAQHSADIDLQEKVLSSLEPAVKRGQIEGEDYGLMFDRVAIARGRPQRFGTQLECQNGKYVTARTEDIAHLEDRRKALNFSMAFKDYKETFASLSC